MYDDGIVKDGQTLRVPVFMCDSVDDPLQHAVAKDAEARKVLVVDSYGRAAGSRPGPCYLKPAEPGTNDAAMQVTAGVMRDEAYSQMCKDLQDAWRAPSMPPAEANVTGYGSGAMRGQRPGDACTIDGFPGHLNDKLECVPDRREDAVNDRAIARVHDTKDALANAWLDQVADLTSA
jgi:hypothetical protein